MLAPASAVGGVHRDDGDTLTGGHLLDPVTELGGGQPADQGAEPLSLLAPGRALLLVLAPLLPAVGKVQVFNDDRGAAVLPGDPEHLADRGLQPTVTNRRGEATQLQGDGLGWADAAPVMFVFSTIGGIVARVTWGRLKRKASGTLSAMAFPLLFILLEAQVPSILEVRTVQTDILIHAPATVVWNNIKSVRPIDPAELPQSWVARIGFPKPVEATLSHEGVGGVREASFTGGLVFTETINRWEPGSDLRFSIHANADTIPKTTLDEHVTVGGAFFDVLDGEYRLEPRPDGVSSV